MKQKRERNLNLDDLLILLCESDSEFQGNLVHTTSIFIRKAFKPRAKGTEHQYPLLQKAVTEVSKTASTGTAFALVLKNLGTCQNEREKEKKNIVSHTFPTFQLVYF